MIWRYMNLEKLEELLESNKLAFTSLDKFPDQYEGHNTLLGRILANIQSDSAKLAVWSESLITSSIRESSFINCWTKGPAENAAFWEIYGKRGTAVAIRSTYDKLRNVLPDEYVVGCVKYVDYNSSPGFRAAGPDSAFPSFEHVYHKRSEYGYENEIRAARIPRVDEAFERPSADVVITNPCDLIDAVYIRQSEPDKIRTRARNLCREYNLRYRESIIDGHPLQIRLTDEQRDRFTEKLAAARIPLDLPDKFYAIVITNLLNESLKGE